MEQEESSSNIRSFLLKRNRGKRGNTSVTTVLGAVLNSTYQLRNPEIPDQSGFRSKLHHHRRTINGTINCAASIPPGLDYSLYHWEHAEDRFSVEEAEFKKLKGLKEQMAACLEIVCLIVAPTNCLEPVNVF